MMNSEIEIKQEIHLGKIFKKSLNVYCQNFPQFISLSLIYAIGAAFIRVLLNKTVGDATYIFSLSVILGTFILSRVSICLIYMASQKIFKQVDVDAQESFLKTKGFYTTYLMVYSAVFLLMGLGFLFFIIPGFYVGTIFLFADTLVVLEKKKFQEVFLRSRELVFPHFKTILLFLLIIVFVSLSPVIIFKFLGAHHMEMIKILSQIFSALFLPFYMIAQVELYAKVTALIKTGEAS